MKCWICNADGKTSEHIAKASDIKAIFPNVSQTNSLFFSTKLQRNVKIGSIKNSSHLKSSALICADCNNARTAPHDKAWEKLSKYLREKNPPIRKGDVIKLSKVFPGSTKRSMLDVHLFFVKLFGCAIIEHSIQQIDISSFSKAIMYHESHPLIYLTISPSPDMKKKQIARTNMEMKIINERCMYAT